MEKLSRVFEAMKSLQKRAFFCLAIVLCIFTTTQAGIIYVKPTGNDTNLGTSWAQAYQTVQKALSVAVMGDNIWVQQGTYYPDEGPTQVNNSRTESFFLKAGVSLFGGFDGTEMMLGQRDVQNNITILSGEIQQDADSLNNSLHVVMARGSQSDTARINGFLITDGYSNTGMPNPYGAGMRIVNSLGVIVTRCVFLDNNSNTWGSALSVDSSSTPLLTACQFNSNTSKNRGAVSVISHSQATFIACLFQGNSANDGASTGGALYIAESDPEFYSCLFSGNHANVAGAVYCTLTSPARFISCTFSGNLANGGGGAVYNNNSNSVFVNSIFYKNGSSGSVDGFYASVFNLNSIPTFSYCLFPIGPTIQGTDLGNNLMADPLFVSELDPLASPQLGGDFHLELCSPAVNAGDSAQNLYSLDPDGLDRVVGENIDIGVFEHQATSITWTGLGSGDDWNNEENWSTVTTVPVFCQDVLIPAGSSVIITNGQAGFGGTLVVELSATLEVAMGGTLEINNNPSF